MTTRLYYTDSYLREFSAEVVGRRRLGESPVAILDRTLFYPTSGGQPHDTGILGEARVLDVQEDADGSILHVLDSEIPEGPVTGRIDWERRFDHMQQHTGQHVLSQAFVTRARAATLSFHLGQETSTIDLDLQEPGPSLIREVEELATRTVFEDRPVRVRNVEKEELHRLGVRKESEREGEIRVIDVEDFDRSPCGGTHVRRTGEIGMIAVLGFERYKGGVRVEFVCGGRALRTLREEHETLKELGRLFSSHTSELPRLAARLFEERSTLAKENARLENAMLDLEAADLRERAGTAGNLRLVRRTYTDRGLDTLKILAQRITSEPGAVAILALSQPASQVVVARSRDVAGDCAAAVRDASASFGGRGGGRPEMAQAGGIPEASLEEWCDTIAKHFA